MPFYTKGDIGAEGAFLELAVIDTQTGACRINSIPTINSEMPFRDQDAGT